MFIGGLMEIKKCEDIQEFVQKIDEIAKAPSSEWQGKTVTKGEPITAKNIEAFFSINAKMLAHYSQNPVLGQSLQALSKRIDKELDKDDAQNISRLFFSNTEKMRLPHAVQRNIMGRIAKDIVQNEPTIKGEFTIEKIRQLQEDTKTHRKQLRDFVKNTSLVAKEWRGFGSDSKASWLNNHPDELKEFTGIQTGNDLVNFLKQHGRELTKLQLFDIRDLSNDHIRDIALFCPKLQSLSLPFSDKITDKAFDHFEKMTNLLSLNTGGAKFTVLDFDKLPKKLENFRGSVLFGVKKLEGSFPDSLRDLTLTGFPAELNKQVEKLIYSLPPQISVLGFSCEGLTEIDLDRLPGEVSMLTLYDAQGLTNVNMTAIPGKLNALTLDKAPAAIYARLKRDLEEASDYRVKIVWQAP